VGKWIRESVSAVLCCAVLCESEVRVLVKVIQRKIFEILDVVC
jgi:hypothetical protein